LVDAISDEGKPFPIVEYTEFVETTTDAGTTVEQGPKRYETLDGLPVQREQKGVYRIPSLGNLRVRSDAEHAP
jgi:hypothetical protein